MRRASLLTHSADYRVLPGQFFSLTIRRIGAHFTVDVNNNRILESSDTAPLFGTYTSHLYIYFWLKTFTLRKFTISTRPSEFDMDEIAGERLIAFNTTPEKLYRFAMEPVYYIDTVMHAITFEQIPVLMGGKNPRKAVTPIEETRNHIQKNYFRKIDFEGLATQCGISYSVFIKKFDKLYGFTPKAYQLEWKLTEACILLKSGKYKIWEVGEMVGFDDQSNFQHMFRKRLGGSPGKWLEK
jgi:AraC-like DNA-binding protein